VAALTGLARAGERSGQALASASREAAREAASDEARTRELFTGLIEPLSDSFEPAACEMYADIFSVIIATLMPEFDGQALLERYRAVRQPRRCEVDPASVQRVYVLSRVTLGADIAVTSVLMDAAKKAFPAARILFAGNQKNAALWEYDPRVEALAVPYGRTSTLLQRLEAARPLRVLLDDPAAIVIDPDSRLTQLGLIPVCAAGRYFFFESRAYGGGGAESLAQLAGRWAGETFSVRDAQGYIAPAPVHAEPRATVSFGVGENPAKRAGAAFEAGILAHLVSRGLQVTVDEGLGEDEAVRVRKAVAAAGAGGAIETIRGPFAPFAARIAASPLYAGYDSSGQHAAAACGVPLVTVFAGVPSERFFARWLPHGRGPAEIVRADGLSESEILRKTCEAVDRLLG
jgi:ADP-heptose:LPS heptosyltransferase